MFICQPLHVNQDQFVKFWSRWYIYPNEKMYDNNIRHELTKERILELYCWKNGKTLSDKKKRSVLQNFVQRKKELEQIQSDPKEFLKSFAKGGAIWRIFWLHCWKPDQFPIYDQHVHRAMAFIETGAPEEIPQYDPKKIDAYIDRYLPFHKQFAQIDRRDVDKALWAFGKFIANREWNNLFLHFTTSANPML
jgi:hypothetical protein